jgi:hypothetical protein
MLSGHFQPVCVPQLTSPLKSTISGRFVKCKFTREEDARLLFLVNTHGGLDWNQIASLMETRNARQCRERYKNYLDPNLRQDEWTVEEDELIQRKYLEFGPKWNKMARFLKIVPIMHFEIDGCSSNDANRKNRESHKGYHRMLYRLESWKKMICQMKSSSFGF